MKDKIKYYKCPICGNVIEVLNGDINRIRCCGKEMELLLAGTTDAATEKHIPVYEIDNNEIIVKVGEVIHPMEEDHYITWVSLVSDNEIVRINLNPGDEPIVKLPYIKDSIIYEYCNLHGLWKNDVK